MFSTGLLLSVSLIACSDTAEQVESDTPENLVTMRFDFGSTKDGDADWFALNDTVMGGVSQGATELHDTSMVFSGTVSTDSNGGFVSLRSPNGEYDLSPYTDVVISYRLEGPEFSMVLADQTMWYMPQFKHEVLMQSDDWTTTKVSLYDFKQYARSGYGESETGLEMSEDYLSTVIRIELINSTFQDSDFRLEIDYIEFQGIKED
ncbi:MAG: CIA30 family protein [Myxococcota bacterium]|nr:CIA30 family protein [Myxococcota bacterium]